MVVPIVLAMDNASIHKVDILVYSIQKHIHNPQIYLITDKKLDTEIDWVYKHAVINLDVQTVHNKWTKNMFLDLYIDVAFPELEKCIYLDYDTIVMDDISDLLLGDDWIIKVADHRKIFDEDAFRLNSGVIAFNLTPGCKKLLKKCRSLIDNQTHDEALIKKVFLSCGAITHVDKNYNVLAGHYDKFGKPKVLHFLGMQKPWMLHPTYEIYFDYLRELKNKS